MTLSKQTNDVETYPLWHATKKANVDQIKKNNFHCGLSSAVGQLKSNFKKLVFKIYVYFLNIFTKAF